MSDIKTLERNLIILGICFFLILGFVLGQFFSFISYEYKHDIQSANHYCGKLGYERFGQVVVDGYPNGSIASLRATCISEGVEYIID